MEAFGDSDGRRAYKKIIGNGVVTLHQRYIYRNYLQISCIDLTRIHHPALWYITWDSSQPVATRPLAIQINGSSGGHLNTDYSYSPYSKARSLSAAGSAAASLPHYVLKVPFS